MINPLTLTLASYTLFNITDACLEKLRLTSPSLHIKLITDEKIKLVFATVKWTFLAISTVYLSVLTSTQWIPEVEAPYHIALLVMLFGTTPLISLSMKLAKITSRFFSPVRSNLTNPNISITWSDTQEKKSRLTLSILQTIFNIALIRFSRLPWVFGINALLTTYTSLTTAKQKDLKASHRIDIPRSLYHEQPLAYHFKSYLTCIAPKNPSAEDNCTLCHEKKQPVDAQFCANNHSYHTSCIISLISQKLPALASAARIGRNRFNNYIFYEIEIPATALPTCPQCVTQSPLNTIEVSVKDFLRGKIKKFKAKIKITSETAQE